MNSEVGGWCRIGLHFWGKWEDDDLGLYAPPEGYMRRVKRCRLCHTAKTSLKKKPKKPWWSYK